MFKTKSLILIVMTLFVHTVQAQKISLYSDVTKPALSCNVGLSGGTDVDFGRVPPSAIQNAPTSATATVDTVFKDSNFNDLYKTGQALNTLTINCNKLEDASLYSFNITVGKTAQKVSLNTGAISGFKLDSTDYNSQILSFALYAKDQHNTATNKLDQFVVPGDSNTFTIDSFSENNSRLQADIDLYPALYWIDKNAAHNPSPGAINSTIEFVVTREWVARSTVIEAVKMMSMGFSSM